MLQLAICDNNIADLSSGVRLMDLHRTSRNLGREYAAFPNGFELISAVERRKRFDIKPRRSYLVNM